MSAAATSDGVTPGHGHDEDWKAMALRVGCAPVRCADRDGVVLPLGRFVAVCRNCGDTFHLFRSPRPGFRRWCRRCGQARGRLEFVARPDAQ